MEGKQKISPRASPRFKHLPKGLEDDELLKITCEFKLGQFQNKDKFILAYTRLATYDGARLAKYDDDVDEMVSVALLTLAQVPHEVKDKMYNTNIVGYLRSRIRTRCRRFSRTNHTLYVPQEAVGVKINRREVILEDLKYEDREAIELLDQEIQAAILTSLERIIYNYRKDGYNDPEIATILGCSKSKISKARQAFEKRFEELRSNCDKT